MKTKPDTSDDAVRAATGRGWDEWTRILNDAGARDWSHKEIVAWLKREEISPWWRQQVTVGYEKITGKRIMGQTADAGFQVGVRKTYPLAIDELWRRLVEPEAMKLWLGSDDLRLEPGLRYQGAEGEGEIRVVKAGDRVRFTRSAAGGKPPSTVQIALSASGPGKTAITFHHERLGGPEERERMRAHWKRIADRLRELWSA
jgi:uncharacterized protein YndB with AHSA1/START domain